MKKLEKPQIQFEVKGEKYSIINDKFENGLDNHYSKINTLITTETGRGKDEKEKDQLYGNSQQLWGEYNALLKQTKFNFNLNRSQWKFLLDLINSKIEYDVNTVFFAIELRELLENMKDVKFNNDTDLNPFEVNATEVTYIYHLIAAYKIKGLTKDAYTFSEILIKIGEISKAINYYDTVGKDLAADIQDWVTLFDESIQMEQPIQQPQLEVDFEEVK